MQPGSSLQLQPLIRLRLLLWIPTILIGGVHIHECWLEISRMNTAAVIHLIIVVAAGKVTILYPAALS